MIRSVLPILIIVMTLPCFGQVRDIDWPLLAKVKWGEKYFKEYDETVYYPDFSPEVLALNGIRVRLSGYIIPVDATSNYYVLSANPYASCFFCGNAGPESVVELQLTDKKTMFTMDQVATFTGTLKLNWDDLEHCNYILQNAKPE